MKPANYLEGLTTLRFFAAALVLIGHCQQNLRAYDIDWGSTLPLFYKGDLAVEFFFVLSGFLLTYLAVREVRESGRIRLRAFFMRRVLRIFPLYYLSVGLGFVLLAVIYPYFFNTSYLSFPIGEGLLYYLIFLPNLVIALWGDSVGALFSLWSIGVEEQFYLFFPFLMSALLPKAGRSIVWLCGITLSYFLLYYLFVEGHIGNLSSELRWFVSTLKFHLMLLGSIFALLLIYASEEGLFKRSLRNRIVQIGIWIAAIACVCCSFDQIDPYHLLHGLVFCLLILIVSNRENRLFNIEVTPFIYLGTISYGIYIFHPYLSYVLRLALDRSSLFLSTVQQFPVVYYVLELLLTTLVAHISYQYFELRFLRLKKRFK